MLPLFRSRNLQGYQLAAPAQRAVLARPPCQRRRHQHPQISGSVGGAAQDVQSNANGRASVPQSEATTARVRTTAGEGNIRIFSNFFPPKFRGTSFGKLSRTFRQIFGGLFRQNFFDFFLA